MATYESAGIRRFALGRVDCIRAASPEALAWAKAMCQGDPHGQMNQPNNAMDGSPKRVQFTIYSVTETWHFSYAILVSCNTHSSSTLDRTATRSSGMRFTYFTFLQSRLNAFNFLSAPCRCFVNTNKFYFIRIILRKFFDIIYMIIL